MKNRENRKLSDASVVAALLIMHVPGLAEKYTGGLLPKGASVQAEPEEERTGPALIAALCPG